MLIAIEREGKRERADSYRSFSRTILLLLYVLIVISIVIIIIMVIILTLHFGGQLSPSIMKGFW